MRTLTEPSVKARMDQLENAMLSALYFWCQTRGQGTDSEWRKQLQTALCGLCDDSIKEIPQSSWRAEPAEKGQEGVIVTIEIL